MGISHKRKLVTLYVLCGTVIGMVGLAFAAVPLYDLFCRTTGFGGTTQTAEFAPEKTGKREMAVRFNADVSSEVPWDFRPVQNEIKLRVGEVGLAFYSATNTSDEVMLGSATFNVTPLKAGIYFNKIDCFCFEEQTLRPGESVEFPVSFFVDPEIVQDRNLDDVKTITLSYTFFKHASSDLDSNSQKEARVENTNVNGLIY